MKNDNVLYTLNDNIKNSKMITYRTSKMINQIKSNQTFIFLFIL